MPKADETSLAVGDEVNVKLGKTTWRARIVEDRGPIGVNKRQLFRVQLIEEQQEDPSFVEVPRKDMTLVRRHGR